MPTPTKPPLDSQASAVATIAAFRPDDLVRAKALRKAEAELLIDRCLAAAETLRRIATNPTLRAALDKAERSEGA